MITRFKIFENKNKEPQVDDYVIIDGDYFDQSIIDFLRNHIGKIVDILDKNESDYPYDVKFDEKIPIFDSEIGHFEEGELIDWDDDLDLLLARQAANKYNL